MKRGAINIVIGGEAGQGLGAIAEILAKTIVRSGRNLILTQDYESRIRGGHNFHSLRVTPGPALAPEEGIDCLIALDRRTIATHRPDLGPQAVLIAGDELEPEGPRALAAPLKQLGAGRHANSALLGVAAHVLGLELAAVLAVAAEKFKKSVDADQNRELIEHAFAWASSQSAAPRLALPPPTSPAPQLLIDGAQAIALGAIAAGVKFYAFYPMTPATSIGQALAQEMARAGLIVEQAEDEIAAINMAIGASFAGAAAMTGTSGGGFALMVEGVSLAGMTETPLVVAVAQRPGPATGMATRTEQADLEFVLHAGHGEFPRAILAPGDVAECFDLAVRAFTLAEKYQTPVFILTDQYLADATVNQAPFAPGAVAPVAPGADPTSVARPYRRFALEAGPVSPRLLPGRGPDLVKVTSDEHDQEGHITEDQELRNAMTRKRLKKLEPLRAEAILPSYFGDPRPELLLISWGSTKGPCLEAMAELNERGQNTACLHFSQVWPLEPKTVAGLIAPARRKIAVEQNATGQFARLLRRETGLEVDGLVSRYDGRPITPAYIIAGLEGKGASS